MYTADMLIADSYYLSGVVARNLQTVSGQQKTDGLRLLNAFLAVKTANTSLVPYYQEIDLTATISQEKYFIANLIAIESMTFTLGSVRYPMKTANRRDYFATARVNNVSSLPFKMRFERTLGGANIYLYFLPASAFPLQIWGKIGLSSVTGNEDLETVYDDYYIEYLRHGLAEYICNDSNISFQMGGAERLKELETMLRQISPPDLTINKYSSLRRQPNLSWQQVNLGQGWEPS